MTGFLSASSGDRVVEFLVVEEGAELLEFLDDEGVGSQMFCLEEVGTVSS